MTKEIGEGAKVTKGTGKWLLIGGAVAFAVFYFYKRGQKSQQGLPLAVNTSVTDLAPQDTATPIITIAAPASGSAPLPATPAPVVDPTPQPVNILPVNLSGPHVRAIIGQV